ncbi:MAG: hypothetical protein JSR78_05145 [Proteobacteria bacterium]|nr:hypothetical protein [Pseudomonadota bacterium]
MKAEDEVVTSPLSRSLDVGGKHLMINVYRGALRDDDWFYEVVDGDGRAEVSEFMFTSDQDALDAALRALRLSH